MTSEKQDEGEQKQKEGLQADAFFKRVLTGAGVFLFLLLLIYAGHRLANFLLVTFGAVLLAILLDGLCGWVQKYTPLNRLLALTLVILTGVGLLVGLGALAGPSLLDQFVRIQKLMPKAIESFIDSLQNLPWLENIPEVQKLSKLLPQGSVIIKNVTNFLTISTEVVTYLLVTLVMAVYLAASPDLYLNGLVKLIPINRRDRARRVLASTGRALRWWLFGRLVTMAAIGILTTIGLMILGIPLYPFLGLLAGLLTFVPFIGALLSAAPAVILALMEGFVQAIYVAGLYVLIQALEGNLLIPLIQHRAVHLPPALLVAAQVSLGVLFGFMGVLLATPLAVTAIALVQMLYIQDVLGDSVRPLGQHGDRGEK